MSSLRFATLSLLFSVFGGLCIPRAVAAAQPESSREHPYRLVLLLAIDQGRADYLDRFDGAFESGLRKLVDESVVFADAHQDHAVTSTGPGHASLSSGSYPSRSGIVGNVWYEENGRKRVYCVQDETSPLVTGRGKLADLSESEGRSPRNLLVSSLPDWIKAADPESKVFSASRKDRAAILMGGKQADAAFWYESSTGHFISSTYYASELPAWLVEFNEDNWPQQYFGVGWHPLEGAPVGEMGIVPADHGWFRDEFPHAIGSAAPEVGSSFYSDFGSTPMMDTYLLQMARRLVTAESLGADDSVDFLSLSLSALDSVGHSYGPNAPEMLDEFRRMDRSIGGFLDFLDEEVGLERTLIIFSSDHGVMPLPEYRLQQGDWAKRRDAEDTLCVQNKGKDFLTRYGAEEDWFLSGFYLNYASLGKLNLLREDVERDAAALFEECSFIRKVWTRSELEEASQDPFHRLYRNGFHPDRSPDLLVQTQEYFLSSQGTGTSHGSPYRYDTHVPLLFWAPGLKPQRIYSRVRTIDVAPTVAEMLGIEVPEELDGVSLVAHWRGGS